ncbi:MAG: potassium/proton antiporter [Bacteroidales bacterium]|jgi:cell volume regulation protein A|nr:potassium/proton antiporter [Bacteroidales bacterium]
MIITLENILLIGSLLLFVSLLAGKTGYKLGVPTLLLFLILGMITGTDGLGVELNNPYISQAIGVIALCTILFSGGMDTKFSDIKPIVREGIVLATLGVLFTALFVGFFIFIITNYFNVGVRFTLLESMLLSSIMSSTDSASVFSILRSKGLKLKHNLRPTLELESGSNDPMAYMLIIFFIQLIENPSDPNYGYAIMDFFIQMAIGGFGGFILGKFAIWIINKIELFNDALYLVFIVSCAFFIFSFTDFIHGNGYLAVYVGGLIIGNKKFVHKKSILKFFDGLTWLMQIVLFLTLGLLVNPHELIYPEVFITGLLIAFFTIFFGRPISVLLSLLPFRKIKIQSRLYISWVGLRGAVPIVFAMYPWIAGLENAKLIFNIVFFITIISLLIQGTSVTAMAKFFKIFDYSKDPKPTNFLDADFSETTKSSSCEITITEQILKYGHRIMDIPFPDKTLVVMLIRDNIYLIPNGKTEIHLGDTLVIITDDREALYETYRQIGIEKDISQEPS